MEASQNTATALPTIEQMQQVLRQSGILDKKTIFPSQHTAAMETAAQLEQVQLANTGSADSSAAEISFELSWFKKYIPKIVGVLLAIQSLRGTYQSINFILVEFPQLEIALEQHHITSQEINTFVSKAVIIAIGTLLSMFFALRLTFLKTKAAKIVSTSIGLVLLIANSAIESYFNQLNSGIVFSEYSASLFEQAIIFFQNALGLM